MTYHTKKSSTLTRLVCLLIWAAASLSLTGCDEESAPQAEQEFGLPGKGDQSCDAQATLCWNGADAERARALMELESAVILGDLPSASMINGIRSLSHKLTGEEQAALEELDAELSVIAEGQEIELIEARATVMRGGFERVYGRVISGYWGAHSTLFSEVMRSDLSSESQGKSDSSSDSSLPSALPTEGSLKPALAELWGQGPFGQYLVTMLTLTGVTNFEGTRVPITDREIVTHRPIDFESRELVNEYSRAAALDSFFAGMASLIPVAGVWISVPYGVYAQFKQRARLALELGTLYGLDPRDPDDFLVIIQGMITAQGFKELFSSFYKSLVGQQGYRIIAGQGGNQFLVGESEFSERRVKELVRLGVGQLAVYGVKVLASIQAKITGSTVKSLLGQVTFGVTTLAEITIDYLTINSMGRELRYMLHPWGWATYLEGMPLLAREEYRRCAHAALIEVARADGDVNSLEATLMQEALLRPFYTQESPEGSIEMRTYGRTDRGEWRAFVDQALILEQASEASARDPFLCLQDTWAEEDSFTQLTLLAWLELMANTDAPISGREGELLSDLGALFSVQRDEARVYDAMRERVAAYPRAFGYVSSALWVWGQGDFNEIEVATGNDTMQAIWRLIR